VLKDFADFISEDLPKTLEVTAEAQTILLDFDIPDFGQKLREQRLALSKNVDLSAHGLRV
jgi:hypothetical protein